MHPASLCIGPASGEPASMCFPHSKSDLMHSAKLCSFFHFHTTVLSYCFVCDMELISAKDNGEKKRMLSIDMKQEIIEKHECGV